MHGADKDNPRAADDLRVFRCDPLVCLLDEIDARLDDAYLGRICKLPDGTVRETETGFAVQTPLGRCG